MFHLRFNIITLIQSNFITRTQFLLQLFAHFQLQSSYFPVQLRIHSPPYIRYVVISITMWTTHINRSPKPQLKMQHYHTPPQNTPKKSTSVVQPSVLLMTLFMTLFDLMPVRNIPLKVDSKKSRLDAIYRKVALW